MIIVYAAHPKFLTVGILNAMINIPLFLCGLKKIGRHFFFGSLQQIVVDLMEGIIQIFRSHNSSSCSR